MNTDIGLFSAEYKRLDDNNKGQLIICDNIYTMDYPEKQQRIITPVNIRTAGTIFQVDAIWDTGASMSCISEEFARKYNLQPVSKGIGVTPAGNIDIVYYIVDVLISQDIVIKNLYVAGFPLKRHDVNFLIGMDIISKGNFNIKNVDNKTAVTFEL